MEIRKARRRKTCRVCGEQNETWRDSGKCPTCDRLDSVAARLAKITKVKGLSDADIKTVQRDTAESSREPGGVAMDDAAQAAVTARIYEVGAKLREIKPRQLVGLPALPVEVTTVDGE